MKTKTIDITAKEWFDKTNGNSYFSACVVINFGMRDEKVLVIPFQYGHENHYKTAAKKILEHEGIIEKDALNPLWKYCKDNGIILRTMKISRCLKKEVVAFGLDV